MESGRSEPSKLEDKADDSDRLLGISPSSHPEAKAINLCKEDNSKSMEYVEEVLFVSTRNVNMRLYDSNREDAKNGVPLQLESEDDWLVTSRFTN